MRTFIAIDFPARITQKIDNIVSYLKTQTPAKAIKWVAAENLHLTLKFLGDFPKQNLGQLTAILDHELNQIAAFDILIEGMGMYPNNTNPRVIWLGISSGGSLGKIHQLLDDALQKIGVKPDRRNFTAHLTIARVRRKTDPKSIQAIGTTLSEFKVETLGLVTIDRVILMKSELTPQGPIYTALHYATLNRV